MRSRGKERDARKASRLFCVGLGALLLKSLELRELPHHLLSTGARTKDVAFSTSDTLGTLALRIVDWQGAE